VIDSCLESSPFAEIDRVPENSNAGEQCQLLEECGTARIAAIVDYDDCPEPAGEQSYRKPGKTLLRLPGRDQNRQTIERWWRCFLQISHVHSRIHGRLRLLHTS
jgi:hypothetical protein